MSPNIIAISGFELYCPAECQIIVLCFSVLDVKMFHPQHQNITEDELYKRVVKCLLWQKKKKKKIELKKKKKIKAKINCIMKILPLAEGDICFFLVLPHRPEF